MEIFIDVEVSLLLLSHIVLGVETFGGQKSQVARLFAAQIQELNMARHFRQLEKPAVV